MNRQLDRLGRKLILLSTALGGVLDYVASNTAAVKAILEAYHVHPGTISLVILLIGAIVAGLTESKQEAKAEPPPANG